VKLEFIFVLKLNIYFTFQILKLNILLILYIKLF